LKKSKIAAILLITAIFFLIGFKIGYSDKTDISNFNLKDVEKGYISDNQYKIDVLEYIINVDLNTSGKSLSGDVTIKGLITDPSLQQIDLNFYDNFNIEGIWLNGDKIKYTNIKTRLTIPLTSTKTDTFYLRVIYSGRPARVGLSGFVFGSINGKSVVYNLNEPVYASSWFPCNDIPSDKAQLKMSITNDSAMTSFPTADLYQRQKRREEKLIGGKLYIRFNLSYFCIFC
jgi:aminopeptidase N